MCSHSHMYTQTYLLTTAKWSLQVFVFLVIVSKSRKDSQVTGCGEFSKFPMGREIGFSEFVNVCRSPGTRCTAPSGCFFILSSAEAINVAS